jgi:eukaryotic-like serine/threonine-protein kinase
MSRVSPAQFAGTERFKLCRLLGRGGMGVVYEAADQTTGARVALKILPFLTPELVLRFKSEFRAVADLRHHNLVRLGDLHADGDRWFFTMELVDGVDIVDHVRGEGPVTATALPIGGGDGSDAGLETVRAPVTPVPPRSSRPPRAIDQARVREVFSQLGRGLAFLHQGGKVHRDVKPSNVLVTRQGRVVVLDFGLVKDEGSHTTHFGGGTPAYMAPEQASHQDVGPAADWYSVGVMLYQSLTGRLPFEGLPHDVLYRKQHEAAPPLAEAAPEAPADLAALCDGLLDRYPTRRPTAEAFLTAIATGTAARSPEVELRLQPTQVFGREEELGRLRETYRAVSGGAVKVIIVEGESGIGKTTLVRAFLDELGAMTPEGPVVLAARCYEREYLPYKAVDGVVDALTRRARHQRDVPLEWITAVDAALLRRLFPAFGRVDTLPAAPLDSGDRDPKEEKARLVEVFRGLFHRLSQRKPVVIFVDDLQWADVDSIELLQAALSGETRLLIIGTRTRSASVPGGAPAGTFLLHGRESVLTLAGLSDGAARGLFGSILPAPAQVQPMQAEWIATAGGHPLFIRELVRHAAGTPAAERLRGLDDIIRARVAALPAAAQGILQVLALAGMPLTQSLLLTASGFSLPQYAQCLDSLEGSDIVRFRGSLDSDVLEIAHDRFRALITRDLSQQRRRELHRALAQAFEGQDQFAHAAVHWAEAGHQKEAGTYHRRAAQEAARALAFDRAAHHYRAALEAAPEDAAMLRVPLADALSSAGKGAEAAELYLAAAEEASSPDALRFTRRAAEELLRSGHVDEGLVAARRALEAAGMKMSRRPLVALAMDRARMMLSRPAYEVEGSEAEVDKDRLEQIDLCWSLSSGLGLISPIQGAPFQTRSLRWALQAREPLRLARGIAGEAAVRASMGAPRQTSEALLVRARSLAQQIRDPQAMGLVVLFEGITAHLRGEFTLARERLEWADRWIRDRCVGSVWELDAIRVFWLESVYYLGDLRPFRQTIMSGLAEASARRSLYSMTNLRTGLCASAWLMTDEPERARRDLEEAIAQWSVSAFHVQHWYALLGGCHIDLYQGAALAAAERIEGQWKRLRSSGLLHFHHPRIAALHLRGSAAAAAAARTRDTDREGHLKRLGAVALRLGRERQPWGRGFAELLYASAHWLRGEVDEAAQCLSKAAVWFDGASLDLYAAAAACARAAISRDDAGRTAALSAFTRAGVVRPAGLLRVMVPAFADVCE